MVVVVPTEAVVRGTFPGLLMTGADFDAYLGSCRDLVLTEIRSLVPPVRRPGDVLPELVLDYPLRAAKGLRPALCIATCRALGGSLEGVLRSAAALELYHNAFLIHDDVEDGSETRRGHDTLHAVHGMPVAINVGDAMLALALQPLLDNTRLVGLGKALRILELVAWMARESTAGQAIELEWIRRQHWDLRDADYVRMVYKKTSCYTFVAPIVIAAIVAGLGDAERRALCRFAALLGIAFQIQDDVLNLVGESAIYGKEIAGDLWEGKHTLILMHAMRSARPAEREHAHAILARPRPDRDCGTQAARPVARLLDDLERTGDLSPATRARLEAVLAREPEPVRPKTVEDVQFLTTLIQRHGSVEHARGVARDHAFRARRALAATPWLRPSAHRDFLERVVEFVIDRDR